MTLVNRRHIMQAAVIAVSIPAIGSQSYAIPNAGKGMIRQRGTQLLDGDQPYHIVGANMWYAAHLGADAAYGDRARLGRELDRLKALGVNNLRIMASAEEGRLKNSIKPGFRTKTKWNETLLQGLDYSMAEIAKRDLKAVLCLTNFWEWSGGMMTYLDYATGSYLDMNDPAHPWPAFPDSNARFYSEPKALAMYRAHVKKIVGRTNYITGKAYRDDPAIMAWQLCNEPRPGESPGIIEKTALAYYRWIDDTAKLIRTLDPNHLVSLGHEGIQGAGGREDIVLRAHQNVDYLTAHIWPLNWGWVNGKNLEGTWREGRPRVADYIEAHIRLATKLNKPLVIEEFGFPRDGEAYDPTSTTKFRHDYYRLIYDAVEKSMADGGPLIGSNFWAWNGEARARHEDYRFKDGDRAYMGDPSHEPQGWYGNFDSDAAILDLVRRHAAIALPPRSAP
jgi:mannan endo-1,4-beta-mannosidase